MRQEVLAREFLLDALEDLVSVDEVELDRHDVAQRNRQRRRAAAADAERRADIAEKAGAGDLPLREARHGEAGHLGPQQAHGGGAGVGVADVVARPPASGRPCGGASRRGA